MILIVIILSAFFACIIAANSYLFQNALLWKMASCVVGLWILCMIITVFVCRKLECSNYNSTVVMLCVFYYKYYELFGIDM